MEAYTRAQARSYFESKYPHEACGFVIRKDSDGQEAFVPVENIHQDPKNFFRMPKTAWAVAEDLGEVLEVVHSHIGKAPLPSHADLVMCEVNNIPWSIIALPGGATHRFEPCGYKAPLIGREYCFGVLDCLTLIVDWYAQEKGIFIPIDFEYEEDFWTKGKNLYMEMHSKYGFQEIPQGAPLQEGDVLVMKIRSEVPNHGAIYLGDSMILHHMGQRLSARELYGNSYRKATTNVLRYKS